MEAYEKSIVPHIEAIYESFTPLERGIADFFIHNVDTEDLSARNISHKLFVSEASLSRFAKKCGYKGYREFVFYYKQGGVAVSSRSPARDHFKTVLNNYQDLLNKSYALMDEPQIRRIVHTLANKKRIYVYGKGSSGLVGMEMKMRFMRIGLNIEAITDSDIMKMNSVLVDGSCAVIGISVSGKSRDVIDSLRMARRFQAHVILMTSRVEREFHEFCDEVMLFAVRENLENGRVISPQFSILVMVDILFSEMLRTERRREALHDVTLEALLDPQGGGR